MPQTDDSLHRTTPGGFTRLTEGASEAQIQYTNARAWPSNQPLVPSGLRLARAWVAMLGEQGLIDYESAAALLDVLRELDALGAESFPFDARTGDVYANIQAYVIDRLGQDVGGLLYMGRSRTDTGVTILRLYIRDELLRVADAVGRLIATLVDRAEQHLDTIMTGYSGSSPAQPATFGHYLASFADAFARDLGRIEHAYEAVNTSLAGAATGSGSDLELDRELVVELLGCNDLIENSREFVTCGDAVLESGSACVILLTHLSELTSDLNMWSTKEFGLIELTDAMSGSSSYMPQKKNPVPLSTIHPVANASAGHLMSMLSLMQTTSWAFDRTELVAPSVALLTDTRAMVEYMSKTIESIVVDEDVMSQRAREQWTTASEVARLVQEKGELDWRSAHWITERFMRLVIERGLTPSSVSADVLDEAALAIVRKPVPVNTEELRTALDPVRFVHTRRTRGGVNPAEVRRMMSHRAESLRAFRRRHEQRRDRVHEGNRRMTELGDKFSEGS